MAKHKRSGMQLYDAEENNISAKKNIKNGKVNEEKVCGKVNEIFNSADVRGYSAKPKQVQAVHFSAG